MAERIWLKPVHRDEPDLDRFVAALLALVQQIEADASEADAANTDGSESEADREVA